MNNKYRIMVIDDDDDVRRMLAMTLSDHYEVVEARDGLDAMSRLDTHEPDIAIIDIMMPLMDGFQLCEAIRNHPRFKQILVMFLSAYSSRENARRSYEVGGNLFLTKPVAPDRVLRNLEMTIQDQPPPLKVKQHTIDELRRMDAAETQSAAEPPPWIEVEDVADIPTAPGIAQTALRPKPEPHPEARPRVLVVDDDTNTRMMLELTLREAFEVTKATNGMEAIERLVEYQPDLVLLDIMMPKMNGFQLLQSIRRNLPFRWLPVVILSAKSSHRDREYAERLGATAYLTKPYKIDELIETLQRITHRPGFGVRPKAKTIDQIEHETMKKEKKDHQEMVRKNAEERYRDLRNMLHHASDDPFSSTKNE